MTVINCVNIANISILFFYFFAWACFLIKVFGKFSLLMFVNKFTLPDVFKKLLSLQLVQIFDSNLWFKKSCKFAALTVSPNSCTKFNSSTAWIITSSWTEWNISLSTFSLMSTYFTLTFQMMPSRPVDTDIIISYWYFEESTDFCFKSNIISPYLV